MIFIGFDTSNYTTSVAAFHDADGEVFSVKRLLDVPPGELGLRQSDALFMHISRLADLATELFAQLSEPVAAVAASSRPRAVDGSYMPCFLAGVSHARVLSSALNVPCFAVSHQQNHVAAAAWSADKLYLLDREHLAFHVSGGTTELLHVSPDADGLPECTRIGGTNDLAAGQIIDRCGVRLGLGFPAGPALEQLALKACAQKPFLPRGDLEFSLSGLENKFDSMLSRGEPPETVARFVLDSLAAVLLRAAMLAVELYPNLPLLCAGGVMCNSIIRAEFERRIDGVSFAKPEFSSDNAAGTAILAARMYKKEAVR